MSESAEKLTPMMQQYFEVKRGLPRDTLLLFRLGDFYELFFDDAVEASRLLGLTLTKRQNYPMAGLPYHASDTYVSKILAAGKSLQVYARAEEVEPLVRNVGADRLLVIVRDSTRDEIRRLADRHHQHVR